MVNGLHLYSAFIQSALQFLPLIHPFTHTFTHQRRLAAMQGTNQLVRSNWGLGVLLRDTSTHPGWDRTGNPPTARRLLYLLSHIAPLHIIQYRKHECLLLFCPFGKDYILTSVPIPVIWIQMNTCNTPPNNHIIIIPSLYRILSLSSSLPSPAIMLMPLYQYCQRS